MIHPAAKPTDIHIRPDNARVLVRPFIPGEQLAIQNIISRAMIPSETELIERLDLLVVQFGKRHPDVATMWRRHFDRISQHIEQPEKLSAARRLYLGALFSGEYALESAALFNPSIVPHPDQSGVEEGGLRFVMSLRATGEGHISSIAFRSGTIMSDHSIVMDPQSRHVTAPLLNPDPSFRKSSFTRKLREIEAETPWSQALMSLLGARFTQGELHAAILQLGDTDQNNNVTARRSIECMQWLTEANYEVHFHASVSISERIIFPVSSNEKNGMEDARFVLFTEDDGTATYYATYTAYNGRTILSQLLETSDFLSFRASTLSGCAVHNKGMAFFPRRIDGKYAMIARQDDENLYLMYSDDTHLWEDALLIRKPTEDWEAVKIGNCGSPIETPSGWLLLTHGVGPMRRYCIGAILLDLNDPSKVIGHLKQPLVEPDEPVRNGYVPNVVYSCGALIHGGQLILPIGLSDTSTTIVTCDLEELLSGLV